MIETLSKRHPDDPLIVIGSSIRQNGYFNSATREQNEASESEMKRLKKKYTQNPYFIPEHDFPGTDHEGTVDGVHPNDPEFDRMLSKTKPQIMKILKKYKIQ